MGVPLGVGRGVASKKIGTQRVHVCYLKVIVGYDVFSCAL